MGDGWASVSADRRRGGGDNNDNDEKLCFFLFKKKNVLKKGYNNYLIGHCTVGNTIDEKDWMHLPAAFSVCRPTSTPSPLVENFRSAKRPQGY